MLASNPAASDSVSKMSGCRWLLGADPRVYYFQRSLPLIVPTLSLVTARSTLQVPTAASMVNYNFT